MKIKGFLRDISGIFRAKKLRRKRIEAADEEIKEDRVNFIANQMHPGKFKAVVSDIVRETSVTKRIIFASKQIPYFAAGSYLTVELKIGESNVTRAYSIVSSPLKSFKEKTVEIIVEDFPGAFFPHYLCNNLKVGDEVILEVGLGDFTYNEYRDGKNIVAIAGGTGITPYISMIHDFVERNVDVNFTLLYGSVNPKEIVAKDELESLVQDNIKIVHVISGNYKWDGEKGFITSNIIKKYSPDNCTYYFCGTKQMYVEIEKELVKLGADLRRIRHDPLPVNEPSTYADFPKSALNQTFEIEVRQGTQTTRIPASSNETIAVALERSGLRIHTCCRGGQCGVCRIKVLKGSYYVPKENDHRRYTDKEYDYVYSCSTFPTSNLIIKMDIM